MKLNKFKLIIASSLVMACYSSMAVVGDIPVTGNTHNTANANQQGKGLFYDNWGKITGCVKNTLSDTMNVEVFLEFGGGGDWPNFEKQKLTISPGGAACAKPSTTFKYTNPFQGDSDRYIKFSFINTNKPSQQVIVTTENSRLNDTIWIKGDPIPKGITLCNDNSSTGSAWCPNTGSIKCAIGEAGHCGMVTFWWDPSISTY